MRTRLRGKVTLLFMMLGILLAVPTVALAADLLTEAELSSQVSTPTIVAPNATTNFDIKVWARGSIPNLDGSSPFGAAIGNAYTMGAGGDITLNSRTIVFFQKNHNYGPDGQSCPATVPAQSAGVTGKGCATDPFIVPATLTVGNLAAGTNGTLSVAAIGANSMVLGDTSPEFCSTSSTANDPASTPDATDCTADQGFVRVNTAPVANNDTNYNTNEDTPLNEPAPGVLGNDTDADNTPLTAVLVSGPSHAAATNGFTLNSDGSFAYTPEANFHGTDTFTYNANDGTADSNVAMVTITVASDNATFTVNSTADTTDSDGCTTASGGCTLREAINAANASTGEDTINFNLGSPEPIQLVVRSQLPAITSAGGALTIDGGSANITIGGNSEVRRFQVDSGAKLTLSNLTVADGGSLDDGGGIYNSGTLEVNNSTLSGNRAAFGGGGIFNSGGTVTVRNSTLSGNSVSTLFGDGGGIMSIGGTLVVNNSTFSSNTASARAASGGGIYADDGTTLTVTNSTFSGNTAGETGGGIWNQDGTATITNSTFSGNSAGIEGGGIQNAGNSTITTRNTIFASSPCAGTITDGGYNLDSGTTCGFDKTDPTKHSLSNTDPKLGALAENGGPTMTHALLADSPAIDQGDSFGATTDQRGEERPSDFTDVENATDGDGSDIGAFELQAPPELSINDVTVSEGNSGTTGATFTVSLSKTSTQTVTVNYATADDTTAIAGTDYEASSGTLSFAPGTTSQSVTVTVIGDNVDEADESYFVNLSNATNATISDTQGIGTITDDDDPPPDTTPPSVTCRATPNRLVLPANNHKLVTITASVQVSDENGSGPDRFELVSVKSNQADSGLGPGDVPNDIQGWTTGTNDTSGQLRAERYGFDRIYTLTYEGYDKAGNKTSCSATVTVPKPTKKG